MMTNNYELFTYQPHNRDISQPHVGRIIKSIEEINLSAEFPIKVNDKYEIIDGQHRFEAWKRLGLPIYYLKSNIKPADTDKAIIAVNANQKQWSAFEFITYWSKKGNTVYTDILNCAVAYRLPINCAVCLVTNQSRVSSKDLKNGTLKAGKIPYYEIGVCINDFHEIFPHSRGHYFIRAFLILYKSKYYNHKRHFEKFVLNRYKLKRCADKAQYLAMFEDILNWHSQKKISLTEN